MEFSIWYFVLHAPEIQYCRLLYNQKSFYIRPLIRNYSLAMLFHIDVDKQSTPKSALLRSLDGPVCGTILQSTLFGKPEMKTLSYANSGRTVVYSSLPQ